MTHSDFNHILSNLKGLSPEQARRLRQELDRQLARPQTPAAPAPAKAAKRARPAPPRKKMTEAEFDQHLLRIGLISSLPDPALDIDAMRLANTHSLRAYDAVQLAAALHIRREHHDAGFSPVTLISADQALNDAATAEGMAVDNPNNHP